MLGRGMMLGVLVQVFVKVTVISKVIGLAAQAF
jgi:hypothetical protein